MSPPARELGAAFLLALAAAVVWTWPLATGLGDRVPHDPRFAPFEGADVHLWLWDLWWARQVVEHGAAPFFSDAVFAPVGHGLALNTHVFLWGLLSVPLQWLGGLAFAYGALVILLPAAAATATYALARALGLGRGGAAFAAAAWAFSPYFAQKGLEHLNLAATPWPPLLLLAWLRFAGAPTAAARLGRALALGVLAGLSLLTGWIATLYAALLVLGAWALAPPARTTERRGPRPPLWAPLGFVAALLAALAVASPLAIELAREAGRDGGESEAAAGTLDAAAREQLYSPRLVDFVTPPGLGTARRAVAALRDDPPPLGAARPVAGAAWPAARGEHAGLGGPLVALLLAAFAAWRLPFARRWLALGGALFLLAWDPGGDPEGLVSRAYRALPGLDSLRVPARAWPYALLPLALAAGAGFEGLARERAKLAGAAAALLALELLSLPYPTREVRVPEAARRIAETERDGSVLTLPFLTGSNETQTWQTVHGRPVVLGYVARVDPSVVGRLVALAPRLFQLATSGAAPPPERLAEELDALGVGHLLLDTERVESVGPFLDLLDALPGWERAPAAGDPVEWWYRTDGLFTLPG